MIEGVNIMQKEPALSPADENAHLGTPRDEGGLRASSHEEVPRLKSPGERSRWEDSQRRGWQERSD